MRFLLAVMALNQWIAVAQKLAEVQAAKFGEVTIVVKNGHVDVIRSVQSEKLPLPNNIGDTDIALLSGGVQAQPS